MRAFAVSWPVVALGIALLVSGCAGNDPWPYAGYEPRPYPERPYALRPVEPPRGAAVRVATRPAPESSASNLSPEEKERLFQEFQDSEAQKRQAITTEEAIP